VELHLKKKKVWKYQTMIRAEYFQFFTSMNEDERSPILKISFFAKRTSAVFMIVSLIWGHLMKGRVYSHFRELKMAGKPIITLIWMELLCQHIGTLILGTNFIVTLLFDKTVFDLASEHFYFNLSGHTYCEVLVLFFGYYSLFYIQEFILLNKKFPP